MNIDGIEQYQNQNKRNKAQTVCIFPGVWL